ncbi:NAD-dependent succinate-semialdehyde dehydrogenase [Yoonia vestfoldensis]|uniref:Alpha-ketoglutaric semialdehyde dehydrogenase n=1 Tax=Yoonia vestfoldensis TaxID=245188 RepID=A0A1Y0EDE0_9RHOB|nr:NAD-dependent succinate-semialdehyde dehydrogenase [Yoonia vestfoldensis]ARU01597.1 alpha-ketoglutaric semialdehyde dehydrogenase [Yoonia vestfoldensis]
MAKEPGFNTLKLLIDGRWCDGGSGGSEPVYNPADGTVLGQLAHADASDLDRALAASQKGFDHWRHVSAVERQAVIDRTVALIKDRRDVIARILTLEMGKPLAESLVEVDFATDTLKWYGEEGRRVYGRILPPRAPGLRSHVLKEPVGPVIGFVAWNFPAVNVIRKVAGAVASGCSIVLKPSEETPGTAIAIAQCFLDAGLPDGVLNLVFGVPDMISRHLMASPVPRKVTVTGSTAVGKHLTRLAADTLKRCTMELGGHAPVVIAADADIDLAVSQLIGAKRRNAGQVCTSPTRFIVEQDAYADVCDAFSAAFEKTKVSDGLQEGAQMGPLIARRRCEWMDQLTEDALSKGARVLCGGERMGNQGSFYKPTVIADAGPDMMAMNDEPFGPMVLIMPVPDLDAALTEANRLDIGLAAYGYTTSQRSALDLQNGLNAGVVGINNAGVSLPEAPFGGVDETGQGSEGGSEGIETFLRTKFVNELAV